MISNIKTRAEEWLSGTETYKEKDLRPREKKNRKYLVGIILIASFFGFMILSRYIFSAWGLKYDWGPFVVNKVDYEIVLWEYSPKQREMQVVLSMENSYTIQDGALSCVFRDNQGSSPGKMRIVIETPEIIVLSIYDVERFDEVALSFEQQAGSMTFYNNKKQIERVENIEYATEDEYLVYAKVKKRDVYVAKIDENALTIEQNDQRIDETQKEIIEIRRNQKYLTAQQLQESTKIINEKQMELSSLRRENERLEQEIKEYEDRIMMIDVQIEKLQQK